MLPLLLTLAPTSLPKFSDYMLKRITLKGKRLDHVITRITLEKVTKGSNTFSVANFSFVEDLDATQCAAMDEFIPIIKTLTRREATPTAIEYVVDPVAAAGIAAVKDDGLAEFDKAFSATEVV
jgi:hypothetical protein